MFEFICLPHVLVNSHLEDEIEYLFYTILIQSYKTLLKLE